MYSKASTQQICETFFEGEVFVWWLLSDYEQDIILQLFLHSPVVRGDPRGIVV